MLGKRTTPMLPTPAVAPADAAGRAAMHAEKAVSHLAKTEGMKRGPSMELTQLHAARATAHATLAVYFQREAQA